jgi:hypothetical protein
MSEGTENAGQIENGWGDINVENQFVARGGLRCESRVTTIMVCAGSLRKATACRPTAVFAKVKPLSPRKTTIVLVVKPSWSSRVRMRPISASTAVRQLW